MHFIEENSEQQNEYMRVHTNLSEIYADIEGELCSKQSNLMNKLKNKFGSLYSDLLPSHYIVVNHVLSLSDFAHSKSLTGEGIKMASENGIILLVKQTYLGDKIFINGVCEQQLIYESKGKIVAGDVQSVIIQQHGMEKEIQKAILLGNDSLALNKLYGATILAYSTISQTTLYYKEKMLLAIFLATLIINEQLQEITIDQIFDRLYHSKIFSNEFLEFQFMSFRKGEFLMAQQLRNEHTQHDEISIQSFKIPKKEKLLFFDMNLSQVQLETMRKKNADILHLLINKTQQSQLQQFYELTLAKANELKHGQITLSEYLNSLKKQMRKNPNMASLFGELDQQIQEQIQQISKLVGKESSECILSGSHLVFSMKPHQIHEKIRILRKFISSQFNENPEIITSRFNRSKGVDKILFSSSPSLAIAIFKPQEEIWFN